MLQFTRRETMELLAALSATDPSAWFGGSGDHDHENEPTLNRFATTVLGAEITGLYLTKGGRFFFNVQHPNVDQDGEDEMGRVGALANFDMNDLPTDFGSLQLPEGREEKTTVRTAFGEYQELALGGDETRDGQDLGYIYSDLGDGEKLTGGVNPDFNGFVRGDGGDSGYLFTNWEHRPGTVSRLTIERDGGRWAVTEKMNVDFSDVEGTWVNCFGTVSPWNTPLTSEENYSIPDYQDWNNPDWENKAGTERLAEYLGGEPNEAGVYDETFPNPYRYGYIVEIEEPESQDPEPAKRFAVGRATHENAVVMPDEQTVYTTSDGTGKCFFKFVADEPQDLSSGTLYVAKATQDYGYDPSRVGFDLEWLELGHASEDEIESWAADYDDITQADYDASEETSYITTEEVEAWARGDAADDRVAFLEPERAAASIGATDEFRKMEGANIARNAKPGDYMYVSMSAVEKTMSDWEGDIQLKKNEYGAVYRMQLDGNYDVKRMEPAITGGPGANVCGGCPYDADPNSGSSVCQDCEYNPKKEAGDEDDGMAKKGAKKGVRKMKDLLAGGQDPENTIANPDNVLVMDDGRVIIGEDTGFHENNMIWVFDPGKGERGRGRQTGANN